MVRDGGSGCREYQDAWVLVFRVLGFGVCAVFQGFRVSGFGATGTRGVPYLVIQV